MTGGAGTWVRSCKAYRPIPAFVKEISGKQSRSVRFKREFAAYPFIPQPNSRSVDHGLARSCAELHYADSRRGMRALTVAGMNPRCRSQRNQQNDDEISWRPPFSASGAISLFLF